MKKLFLFLTVLAVLFLPAIVAAECPAPKIYIVPASLHADTITAEEAGEFNAIFSSGLSDKNPGVVIHSAREIGEMLNYSLSNPGTQTESAESIAQKSRAEYVAALTISKVGSRYVITSSLTDADLAVVVARASAEADSKGAVMNAVTAQVEGLGDLASLIQAHETQYPVPPRAPTISVTVNPTSVTSEDIRDQTTMTATVTNCRGEPVKGTTVYFESNPARGRVTGAGESKDSGWWGWQYAVSGADGTARATFTLDPARGTGAGKTTVKVGTGGRGNTVAWANADITIVGVILTTTLAKSEIPPDGQTDITIALFELDANNERRPLEGRGLYVEKHRISNDAQVIVAGQTDSHGNPVTDANGEVHLKFIAGKKEGMERLRILFQDVGVGYGDAIETWAEVRVKKDEYTGTIDWKESGSLNSYLNFQGESNKEYTYDFTFNADITKEKGTGQETTDASFRYHDDLYLFDSGRTTASYGIFQLTVPFEETWNIQSDVSGSVSGHQTVNTVMQERMSSYAIPVTPFPVPMPVSGTHAYESTLLLKGRPYSGDTGVTWLIEDTTWTDNGVIHTRKGAMTVPGKMPVTGIPGNALLMSSSGYDLERYLSRFYSDTDSDMVALKDDKITSNLVKKGKNVYEQHWSVHDTNSYHGLLFSLFNTYDATLDMDQSFNRQVTLTAVKL